MGLCYTYLISLYSLLLKCAALWHPKAKALVRGRSETCTILLKIAKSEHKRYWFHCASLGEYDMALPLMQVCLEANPDLEIVVSFYSPSGMQHYHKRGFLPTAVFYLPADTMGQMKALVEAIEADRLYLLKYEFWPSLLAVAKKAKLEVLAVSTILRPSQVYFKWYGGIYKKILSLFYAILVQDENSKKLISPIFSEQKISVTGDTRFDRVLRTSKSSTHFDWLQKLNNGKIIIAGSTWEKDHILLASLAEKYTNLNWIVVPHHVDSTAIQKCVALFNNATTLTSFAASHQKFNNAKVIIVDQIGLLRNLYQHAYITYIGGGFGAEGIHNVLEPAAFGKPVFWGPNDEKYIEARGLVNAGGGFKIHDVNSFSKTLEILSGTPEKYTKACESSANFIAENAGATQKTMEFIYENRLLIN